MLTICDGHPPLHTMARPRGDGHPPLHTMARPRGIDTHLYTLWPGPGGMDTHLYTLWPGPGGMDTHLYTLWPGPGGWTPTFTHYGPAQGDRHPPLHTMARPRGMVSKFRTYPNLSLSRMPLLCSVLSLNLSKIWIIWLWCMIVN